MIQGQYEDVEAGLYQNCYRFYDPNIGRYISQDPIGLMGGLNAYQYTPNLVGYVDPLGLSCEKEGDNKSEGVYPIVPGITFKGTVYRYEQPDRFSTTWDAHKWNQAANHRYIQPGIGGVYGGTTAATAEAVIAHYGALQGRELVSK